MLSLTIILPLVAVLIIGIFASKTKPNQTKLIALVFSLSTLIISLFITTNFEFESQEIQLATKLAWLPDLGLNYSVGIDGLSLPLVILNCLLITLAIFGTDTNPKQLTKPKLYFSLILILSACVSGALIAQNLLLFFIFYEIKLVPIYILISIWGGEKSSYSATKYLLYTAFSGIFILTAFLGIVLLSNGSDFDYENIQANVIPLAKQTILLITLIIGFAIKIPLIPFHTWLPDAYTESSTPVSMLLGGIISKLGTYGLIRFGLGLFPDIWQNIALYLALASVISAIYGSLIAISQTDIKKMIAYASVAHISFVVLATAAGTPLGIVGAICQMFAHGLIVALLFHLAGIIENKTHTRDIGELHGLMNPYRGLPFVGGLMITAVMASAGIPGMVGFVGEFLSFQGSFTVFPIYTLVSLIATGLTAVYFVILLNRVFFGRIDNQKGYLEKVNLTERLPAIVLTAFIIILGVNPSLLTMFTYQ